MEEVVIQANHREVIGKKVKVLRHQGLLPAVVYGHGVDSLPITLDMREANRVLDRLSPSALVVVDIEGDQHYTLVRDKQRNPIVGSITHVDFQAVSLTEKVRADLNINLVGEAPALEAYFGILVQNLEQLSIECLPKDLPNRIDVDVSGLEEISDSLLVSDLVVPDGVEILNDLEDVVVVVVAQAAEEEEEEVELEEEIEPEVVERGKIEEEEEEEEQPEEE
jgi:large subunit ribosomal protein L25